MYHSSSGHSSLSSSSWSKEGGSSASRSSRSGASMSGSTQGRSPRRSRSPSPRGRRRRSPSSSRSSCRSPSPRHTSRVRSPSGGSWRSRRGSEQRDGSLNRRFLGSCSPSRHSESSVEQNLWTEFNSDFYGIDPRERWRPSDRLGSPDSLRDIDRGYFDNDSVFVRDLSHSRNLERYRSRQESPPSSFSTRYDKDYHDRTIMISDCNMNDDRLEDLPRESDRDGKLFTKSLHPSEEERFNPKHPQYDREDRLLDVSTDPQGSLSENRNYYKRRLSSSQMYPGEDFRKFVSSRRNREEEELSKNICQDCPGSDYVIPGLTNSPQSSESRYLYRPDEAPAMPKKSILKKRGDDPIMQTSEQNFESFLRKQKYQESTSESADLHDDFLLPHERALQNGSGISHILDRMADSTSAQGKRRPSSLDVEEEEKFLYGDDEDDSNIRGPSAEKPTVNGGKESVSLNKRSPSLVLSVKRDTSEESEIEYEKIHDLLKTIGLNIEVAEIGKGAVRTQERLHGKKTLRSLDGPFHKADSSEKDNTHPSEANQKNSLSPCDSSQPSNDVSSASVSKHANTLEYGNSAGPPEQSFPSVSVTPSAPPLLPNLPLPPPPVSPYSLSHFSAFIASQVLQNYPTPTMAPPNYNAYGHSVAYSASNWPMYAPPQHSNPAHGLVPMTAPPQPTRSNLKVIETVSTLPTIKENLENKRNKSVLVKVPITHNFCRSVSRSSKSCETKIVSDGKNPDSEKPQESKLCKKMPTDEECNKGPGVTVQSEKNSNKKPYGALFFRNLHCDPPQVRERLEAEKEVQEMRLQYLKDELDRIIRQRDRMAKSKRKKIDDPLLAEVKRAKGIISDYFHRVKSKTEAINRRLSKLDKDCSNKNPYARQTLIQETECGLKQKLCEKQKESTDEGSTEVARKEESEITTELREEGDENESSERKDNSHGHKVMIALKLKKGNTEHEKEGEKGESQKESSQLSSENCSLRKTDTNNQRQDQDVAAPNSERTKESKCRESNLQSGNPDSKPKVTVTKGQNLGMRTKEQKSASIAKMQQRSFDRPHHSPFLTFPPRPQKSASVAKMQQQSFDHPHHSPFLPFPPRPQKSASVAKMQQRSFDRPHHSPFLPFPPRPPLPLFPYPGSGPSYNMCIPPFSDSLLFTLHRATEERRPNKPW